MAEILCAYTELKPIHKLIPHPENPHKHSPEQIDRLAKLIDYQGIRHPIIVSNRSGFIVAGHGRLAALKKLNVSDVPIDYQDFDNEAQEYAFIVSDNAIGKDEWAALDVEAISKKLDIVPIKVEFLGIKDFQINNITEDQNAIEDEVPEPKEAVTVLGDIYEIGNHRLVCGDSTSIDAVEKLMNGEKADVTFTSPPYNAGCFGYDGGKDKYKGKSDDKSQDDYFDFLVSFTNIALNVSSYVLFNNQFLSGNRHALAKFFGHYFNLVKDVFPWIKNTAPPNVNKGVFTNRFEFFLCLEKDNSKKGFPVDWQGKFHNIIDGHTAAKENVTEGSHSATMPLYVPEWFIERLNFINTIYDPFGGSGSTLIACEKTNRKCFMMELDPHYCDVIVTRWCKYTGQTKIKRNGEEVTWNG